MADPNIQIPASHFEILGQYFYSLGAGAAGMHITRQAVGALYDHYKDYIHPEDWKRDGTLVLYWIERIGSLAAQLATQKGAVEIDDTVVIQAAEMVEKHVKATKCGSSAEFTSPISDGKYCHS